MPEHLTHDCTKSRSCDTIDTHITTDILDVTDWTFEEIYVLLQDYSKKGHPIRLKRGSKYFTLAKCPHNLQLLSSVVSEIIGSTPDS